MPTITVILHVNFRLNKLIEHTVSIVGTSKVAERDKKKENECVRVLVYLFLNWTMVLYLIALIHHLNKFKICVLNENRILDGSNELGC